MIRTRCSLGLAIPLVASAALAAAGAPGLAGGRPEAAQDAEDSGESPDDTGAERMARQRAYLERRPYHDAVFRALVDAARARNELDALVADYARRASEEGAGEEGDGAPARIVLARLLGELGLRADALRRLAAVPATARSRRLAAHLHLGGGDLAAARAALRDALELVDPQARAEDADLAREMLRELAEVELARNDSQGARAAYAELADADRASASHLADVAHLLAQAGLTEDAVALLREAAALAAGDVPRRARLLAELGRLHEERRDGEAALACYAEVLPLLARDHWLRRDVLARALELHRVAGTLTLAAVELRRALAADPEDLDARLALVEALSLQGREREALAELSRATEHHPGDLELSDRYARALARLGEDERHVAELQRALALAPRSVERRFALGLAFAGRGELEGAEREWGRALADAAGDPALHDRVARAWDRAGEPERARRLMEAAIALAPREARRHGDLARLLSEQGRPDEARLALGRAEAELAGLPTELEELSALYEELGDLRSARRALGAAHRADPTQAARLGRLARLSADLGDRDDALAAVEEWLESALDGGQRAAALELWAELNAESPQPKGPGLAGARGRGRASGLRRGFLTARQESAALRLTVGRGGAEREELVRRLAGEVEAGTRRRAPYLQLAHLADAEGAVDAYRALLERWPADLAARRALAELHAGRQETDLAVAQLDQLAARDPARARAHHLEAVRVLAAELGREPHPIEPRPPAPERRRQALERLDAVRADLPRDAGTWLDLARWYARLDVPERAMDCLEQALRIDPDDGRARLALARLAEEDGETERAYDAYRSAWRRGDDDVRGEALRGLHGMLARSADLDAELLRLRLARRRNPFDVDTPLLLAELSALEGDHAGAIRVLGELLRRGGEDPELLRRRARAYAAAGRRGACIDDLRRLAAGGEDVDGLVGELVAGALQRGEEQTAAELGMLAGSPTEVARLFLARQRYRDGVLFLDRWTRRHGPPPAEALLLQADLYEALGEERQALRALARHEECYGADWTTALRIGELAHRLRDSRRTLEQGRRLVELGAPEGVVDDYFTDRLGHEELTELLCRRVVENATDAGAAERALSVLLADPASAPEAIALARRLRDRARTRRLHPPDHDAVSWSRVLGTWVLRFHAASPGLALDRAEELERRGRGLSADAWVELLWLVDERPRDPGLARRAADEHPEEPEVLFAAARRAERTGDRELAARLEAELAPRLATPTERRREEARRRRALAAHAAALLRDSPPTEGLTAGSPLLERAALVALPLAQAAGDLPCADPGSRDAALARLARHLAELGRPAEARAALVRCAPLPAEALVARVERAWTFLDCGLHADAAAILADVGRVRARLERDPELSSLTGWRAAVDGRLATAGARYVLERLAR